MWRQWGGEILREVLSLGTKEDVTRLQQDSVLGYSGARPGWQNRQTESPAGVGREVIESDTLSYWPMGKALLYANYVASAGEYLRADT